ncbi:MAG: hypothetical protein QXS38_00175 [Candidatus Pacearchaeota archaeon]
MDKKAKIGDIVMDNIVYLIILIIFFAGMMTFVYSKMNGAAVWEDYYAKEIVKVIDLSEPGDEITLDVHKATEIAQKNKVDFDKIFSFDNLRNEVCVRLSAGRASCYYYFNNVSVVFSDKNLGKWIYLAEPVNRLHISIKEGI